MKKYLLLLILLPLMYVGSYGYYCWKKGEKAAAAGVFIAVAASMMLGIVMFFIE